MTSLPRFLRGPDPNFGGFSHEQVADLYRLRALNGMAGQTDRFHAGVPRMRDDGAMQIVPLTIELVESHAYRYWSHIATELFVLAPEGWSGIDHRSTTY